VSSTANSLDYSHYLTRSVRRRAATSKRSYPRTEAVLTDQSGRCPDNPSPSRRRQRAIVAHPGGAFVALEQSGIVVDCSASRSWGDGATMKIHVSTKSPVAVRVV
jgi:hypothetical protein